MKYLRPLLILTLLAAPLWSVLAGNAPTTYPPAAKGLAQLNWSAAGITDRALLGVESWYAWGMGACSDPATWPACVPMNRNWDVAAQTYCPPRELLGNEPTNPEPGGHPIAASVAASVTVAIEALCPQTQIIAANIHLNNIFTVDGNCCDGRAEAQTWLTDYLAAYKLKGGHAYTHTLGIHCYSQHAGDCLLMLRDTMRLPFSGDYWLTEFAMWGEPPYTNSGAELEKFLTQAPIQFPRIRRYYIWTNRTDPSCCPAWPFELVNGDGTLTAMGQVYAAWEPPAVSRSWLPAVNPPPPGYP